MTSFGNFDRCDSPWNRVQKIKPNSRGLDPVMTAEFGGEVSQP
jgi:hypothetical protein